MRASVRGRRPRLAAGVATLAALAVIGSACHLPTMPSIRQEEAKARSLPQTSYVFAADGTLLTTFHAEENRTVIPLSKISRVLRRTVVAVEDRRFYHHNGVDVRGLLRAAYVDASEGRVVQGGSTITEQYVKNRYLGDDRTISRKVKEAILAFELERRMTKNQILAAYLNTVYFGQGAYGIQAAAKTYFSEPASAIDLQQAALLTGLIQAPSAYDPVDHPHRAKERRNVVLGVLHDAGMITGSTYRRTLHEKLGLRLSHREGRYRAPYFVQFVKQWLFSNPAFGATRTDRENLLYRGGLRIYTTLVPRLQRIAETSIKEVLVYKSDPYAAMTVIDPRSGEIKAMVGGRDYFSRTDPVAQVNLATGGSTGRQAGSTFKPFALVAAMENGIPPQKVYAAPPEVVLPLNPWCRAPGETVWPVHNFDGTGAGQLTVEQATIDSVNVVYAQIVQDLGGGDACAGADKVVGAARALGLNPPGLLRMGVGAPLARVPSAVLGSEQVNTVEMASAYATLAAVGYRFPPVAVTKVTDSHGRVLWQWQPRPTLAVDRPVAFVTDQILQKVILQGTGTAAAIGRPAIGKTGTAEAYRDAWFVGAIPQLSAAVWVGFPQGEISMVAPRTRLPQVLGGTWPAQIWRLFMQTAAAHMPVRPFPKPVLQYVTVPIDTSRNCQANQFTQPYLIQPVRFIQGTQPPVCLEPRSYQPLLVPSVIGLPATDATSTLEQTGFQVQIRNQYSDQTPGTVVQQDPPAGEQVLQQSTITLSVAVPYPRSCQKPTPSPSGSASPSTGPSGSPTPATKSAPSPTPSASPTPSPTGTGTPAPAPTATPCPSPGSTPLVVPNVTGLTRDDALARLQQAGFGAAALISSQCKGSPHCTAPSGVVWKESPAAGTLVPPGATVTVWVNP